MPQIARVWRDIDVRFVPHPVTGDVTTVSGDDAIKQHLRLLVHLLPGEVLMRPDIEGGVTRFLFEVASSDLVERTVKKQVATMIKELETRIDLVDVQVSFSEDENDLQVGFVYKNKNDSRVVEYETFIKRIR